MPLAELIQFSSNIITVKIYGTMRTNIQARGSRESLCGSVIYTRRKAVQTHSRRTHTEQFVCSLYHSMTQTKSTCRGC